MIAPGGGSGAPGTGHRAESAAVNGNGSFRGLAFSAFARPALLVSGSSESIDVESKASESETLSTGTLGRGAWIARGVHRGGAGSLLSPGACLAPTGALLQPKSRSGRTPATIPERTDRSKAEKQCIRPRGKRENGCNSRCIVTICKPRAKVWLRQGCHPGAHGSIGCPDVLADGRATRRAPPAP